MKAMQERRAGYVRKGVTALGLIAAFGGAYAAPTVEAASGKPVRQAVARSIKSFTSQLIGDYSRLGPKQKKTFSGDGGIEIIEANYNAKDAASQRMGHYSLIASLDKGANGKLDPGTTSSIRIQEFNGDGNEPIYYFDAQRTDTKDDWLVQLQINEHGTLDSYTYTTGPINPRLTIAPLTLEAFQPIASQAQTILGDAKHHTAISTPTLPLPPPTF